jgi:hypothetical protein
VTTVARDGPSSNGETAAGRPLGITLLATFFAFGALMAGTTALALALPGGFLEPIWRLNPQARAGFLAMGAWAIPLMIVVAAGCAMSAVGLARSTWWGHRLALALLAVNLLGDAGNALVRGDLRTLIGLPIGGAMIAYLLTPRVRRCFARPATDRAAPAA